MEELIGKTLGRYQITALVGHGGMATVYKARDPGLGRVVAIKLLHPHLSADPSFVARFRREARAVAAMRHSNIVRVSDFDSSQGSYYMVMEFVDGPTLATVLRRLARRRQHLSPEEALRIFPPLCSAIDYANAQGMVHRDIKPSNIILTREGEPILTDYGIAKITGATSYTMPGTVVGSAQYMSPEQAQGLLSDNRSDIYSLGICLFEALTGRVPFDGATTATILAQHINASVPVARSLNPDLPEAVEAVLAKVLAKDPAQRYQKGADLAVDLEEALQPALTPAETTVVEEMVEGGSGATRIEKQVVTPNTPVPGAAAAPAVPEAPAAPAAAAPGAVPDTPAAAPASLRRVRGRLLLVLVAAAVLVLGAGATALVVLLSRGDDSTPSTTSTAVASSSVTTTTSTPASSSSVPSTTTTSTTTPADAAALAAADALLAKGKILDGLAAYDTILSANPWNNVARAHLGMAYLLLPTTVRLAEQELLMVVDAEPTNAMALAFLGLARFDLAYAGGTGDYAGAEQALKEALRLEPGNAPALAFLGEVYTEQGRGDEGLAEAQRAVEQDPRDFWAQSGLGRVRAFRGEWSEAVGPYQEAVALQPYYAFLHLLLSEALRRTERYDEAVARAGSALALGQGHEGAAYTAMGHALWLMGDLDAATAEFEKALALDDGNAQAHWGLGAVLYRKGDYAVSVTHLEKAIALKPNEAQYHSSLGACLVNLQRYPQARAELERALQLDPNLKEAQNLQDQLTAAGH